MQFHSIIDSIHPAGTSFKFFLLNLTATPSSSQKNIVLINEGPIAHQPFAPAGTK